MVATLAPYKMTYAFNPGLSFAVPSSSREAKNLHWFVHNVLRSRSAAPS
jgi:hypothetical protein